MQGHLDDAPARAKCTSQEMASVAKRSSSVTKLHCISELDFHSGIQCKFATFIAGYVQFYFKGRTAHILEGTEKEI